MEPRHLRRPAPPRRRPDLCRPGARTPSGTLTLQAAAHAFGRHDGTGRPAYYYGNLLETDDVDLYRSPATVNSSGFVEVITNQRATFLCEGSISLFPYDHSECEITLVAVQRSTLFNGDLGLVILEGDDQFVYEPPNQYAGCHLEARTSS